MRACWQGTPSRAAAPGREGVPVLLAALVAGLGVWAVVGGPPASLLGIGCAVVLPRAASRLEPRSARARREELERQAPLLADLMAAILASGAPMRFAAGRGGGGDR